MSNLCFDILNKVVIFHHPATSGEASLRKPKQKTAPVSRVLDSFADFEGDKQFATTLARGLEILRCFTPEGPTLGNKDLAERTGLPKPTISRFKIGRAHV